MIRRIVLVRLKDEWAAGPRRDQVATHSRETLAALDDVRAVDVLPPADERSAKDWDLCLDVELDDLDAFARYAADPVHRAYVDEYLLPKSQVIKAWNFKK